MGMRCSECGTKLEDDALFCPNCGKKIANNIEEKNIILEDNSKYNQAMVMARIWLGIHIMMTLLLIFFHETTLLVCFFLCLSPIFLPILIAIPIIIMVYSNKATVNSIDKKPLKLNIINLIIYILFIVVIIMLIGHDLSTDFAGFGLAILRYRGGF
jgi:RNA polymerase subunit RPABC4/transcription elongation factor Spt4